MLHCSASADKPSELGKGVHHIQIALFMQNLFSACPCGIDHLKRMRRSTWMRLLPWLRLFRCDNCGKHQLHSEREIEAAKVKRDTRTRFLKR